MAAPITTPYEKMMTQYIKSIDISLGRIATALEKLAEDMEIKEIPKYDEDDDILIWHKGYTTTEKIKKDDKNKKVDLTDEDYSELFKALFKEVFDDEMKKEDK